MIYIIYIILINILLIHSDVLPSKSHVKWADFEVGVIIHFGITTFTVDIDPQGYCDFNTGKYLPHPDEYSPELLDTDQWMRSAKALGAKYAVFVAQHCDGFSQWPTEAEVDGIKYNHSVKASKWRDGKGDVVRDFVESCKKYGIVPGVYYSLNYNYYANAFAGKPRTYKENPGQLLLTQEQYDKMAVQQMIELWKNYGEMAELWFDGCYTDTIRPMIEKAMADYAPDAVAFQGPSEKNGIRWVGNEGGEAPYPSWARAMTNLNPGAGDPDGIVWAPPECDTILRNSDWFWRPNHPKVGIKTLDRLIDTYHTSVGTSCNLLLDMNPDWSGRVPDIDEVRYKELGDYVSECYGTSIASTSGKGLEVILEIGKVVEFNRIQIMENIVNGQNIRKFSIQIDNGGSFSEIVEKESIGHKLIVRLPNNIKTSRVKLLVKEYKGNMPDIRDLSIYLCSNTGGSINTNVPYPPMGYIPEGGKTVTENEYYNTVDKLVSTGMSDTYNTVIIEEPCFSGRDGSNSLVEDSKRFSKGLKQLGDYIISKNMRFGMHLYTGDKTREGCVGNKGYEANDIKQLAGYGVTHFYVDWTDSESDREKQIERYNIYKNEIIKYKNTVLSIDNNGTNSVYEWGVKVANTWKNIPYNRDRSWESIIKNIDIQDNLPNIHIYSGPHHFNDVGYIYSTKLEESELIAQYLISCVLNSPKMLFGQINSVSPSLIDFYKNKNVIDICNDKLGQQGKLVLNKDNTKEYAKQLSNTDWIILFLNNNPSKQSMTFYYPSIGSMNTLKIKNAITGEDLGTHELTYTTDVPAHSVIMIRGSL